MAKSKALSKVKPLTKRAKRAIAATEPKLVELRKLPIFLRGKRSNAVLNGLLHDLYALKKPEAVMYEKNNNINPFPDSQETSDTGVLEFMLRKSNASLFVVSHTSKKKPNRLYFGRTFDFMVMDVFDLAVANYQPISSFKGPKAALGARPCFVFNGALFSQDETFKTFKSVVIDFFHGEELKAINADGVHLVISITADDATNQLYWRTYYANYTVSGGNKTRPLASLVNHGPDFDFTIKQSHSSPELTLEAYKKPLAPGVLKSTRNLSRNKMGDKLGSIHLGNQDLDKLVTRKVRALKGK